ncbi:hypothetical protein PQ455_20905 (plasmid) [Sphingomonas naphthae]|jgi:hypothetical protein|uniref:Uncharacterized protein n=1 Tax=Sphingomonas naphthae TaxID=1813468 RepID=A0ABY7TRT3_9SPHN|nr:MULTISPECIES: hypothetical protein [Sphingomonadaceae]AJR27101.1 hypothetical protein TZ53_25245 [Sphingobium sp. YBL2]QBM06514.1 hypothetical protein [uncultured bacterium]WCT75918.1 hypothetical protein PQ455_20905 [Sphingomonas naphthae]
MTNKANDNGTDPFYSKVMADSGAVVSGGAALLVRAKARGGPSNIIRDAIEVALEKANEAVHQQRRSKIKLVR